MKETRVTLPELALIAGTRGMLGAGLGLLFADRFSRSQRKAVGMTLLRAGVVTTVPLAFEVLSRVRSTPTSMPEQPSRHGWAEPVRQFAERHSLEQRKRDDLKPHRPRRLRTHYR